VERQQPSTSRYERGRQALEDVEQGQGFSVIDHLADFAPDMGRFVVEFAYGDVFDRPGLSRQHRQLATIGALTAAGTAPAQLRFHIEGARNVGCSTTAIVEAIIHVSIYAGFPATLNAITAARDVFARRHDKHSPDLHKTAAADRYTAGWDVLSAVDGTAGQKVVESLRDLAPDLARFLVEFPFGDIYSRPGLDLKSREIVTVATCIALGTAMPQLKVHTHGLLNAGGTEQELIEVIIQMAVYAGFPAALNALSIAREVLTERIHEFTLPVAATSKEK
jgi:4-carboxymuconolactone decarboxylase